MQVKMEPDVVLIQVSSWGQAEGCS